MAAVVLLLQDDPTAHPPSIPPLFDSAFSGVRFVVAAVFGDAGINEDFADSMSSDPPDYIKPLYVNLRWLPLTHDQGGNHIGLDFDPGPQGAIGQIITFGRDDEEKRLVASSFTDFIDTVIEELQKIEWTLELGSGWQINDPVRGEAHYHDWPRRRPSR